MRKTSHKSRLGDMLWVTWSLLKTVKVMKTTKDWETVIDQRSLRSHDNQMQCGSLKRILKQQKNIHGETGDTPKGWSIVNSNASMLVLLLTSVLWEWKMLRMRGTKWEIHGNILIFLKLCIYLNLFLGYDVLWIWGTPWHSVITRAFLCWSPRPNP